MVLEAYCLIQGENCGGKAFDKIKTPAFYSWIDTLIVVSPMRIPTYFPRDLVIYITGKNYLLLWSKATISASVV